MKNSELKLRRRINDEAYGKYGDKLFVMRERADAMKKVLDISLTKEKHRFTEAQLDKMQNIKDSGMLDGKEKVEDPKIVKKFSDYVDKRIAEEIKKGNLTEPEKAFKKSKKYARKTKRSAERSNRKTKGSSAKGDSNS